MTARIFLIRLISRHEVSLALSIVASVTAPDFDETFFSRPKLPETERKWDKDEVEGFLPCEKRPWGNSLLRDDGDRKDPEELPEGVREGDLQKRSALI